MGVKWIKLTTDMFDNRKIRYLRKLPEGNNIVLIWIMLLTMAGRCNSGGMVFLTENIPYTPKMLADELDFDENTVQLALTALTSLGMIVTDERCFSISNWEEYQNIDGMERIREQTKARVSAFRERQKQPAFGCNVTSNVTVTQCNGTDIDIDKDIDKDIEKEKEIYKEKEKEKERRVFTPPTLDEVSAYCKSRNNGIDPETFLSFYTARNWMSGKTKITDWKSCVITWEKRASKDRKLPTEYSNEGDELPSWI